MNDGRFDLDLDGHADNVALLRSLLEADPLRPVRSGSGEGELLCLSRVGDGREILRARITHHGGPIGVF